MKTKLLILLSLILVLKTQAGSATWSASPIDGVWTEPGNWMPATVPNSPTDIATFATSTITKVTVPIDVEVDSIIFNPGASAFTIMTRAVSPASILSISGAGVINNSGITQNFLAPNSAHGPGTAEIDFLNNASAGSQTVYTTEGMLGAGGGIHFFQSSSAGSATFINEASPIINAGGGFTEFVDTSTAANGIFIAQGSRVASGPGSQIIFVGSSTAADGIFTCEAASVAGGSGGLLKFDDIGSTAGNAVISLEGATVSGAGSGYAQFFSSSTAGNASITAQLAAVGATPTSIEFTDDSTGGLAQLSLSNNSQLIVSNHHLPGVSVGSAEGGGNIILGTSTTAGRRLSIGTNNLNTTFTGTITDGGNGGALTKIGRGRLTLSGASTYTGTTVVNGGQLLVTNTNGSATGDGMVIVNSGTLGGTGIIAGPVRVGPASVRGAFLAPGTGRTNIGTLTILGALTLDVASTYNCGVNTNAVTADQVACNGVGMSSTAIFSLVLAGNNPLPIGTVFTVINNNSASPIVGSFSNLPDGAIVNIDGNNLEASYTGGDGNDLTLTVVP